MTQNEDKLISLLTGERTQRVEEMEQDGVLPPYLAAKYARESAAQEAADRAFLSLEMSAALLRASFLDSEEDVRSAARRALIIHGGVIGDAVLFALTMDSDPDVRESALDESLEIRDEGRRIKLTQQVAKLLTNDKSEPVRTRAREFANSFIWQTEMP